MSDNGFGDGADWNPSSFGDWLAQVAESEGVSEQAVLDRMMSSYWILDELSELMDDPGRLDTISERRRGESEEHLEERSEASSGDGSSESKEILQLLEVMDTLSESGQRSIESRENPDSVNAEIDRIRDDIDRLTTRIDTLVDQKHQTADSHVEGQESLTEDLTTEIKELSQQLEELETRVSDIESRQGMLQERVNDNFSHVEDILQYVVDELDNIEKQADGVSEEISAIRSSIGEDERLRELKKRANAQDIKTARCEKCEGTVTISLLTQARCPSCDSAFDGIMTPGGAFGAFRSAELTVTSNRSSALPQTSGSDTDRQSVSREGSESDDFSDDLSIQDILRTEDDDATSE